MKHAPIAKSSKHAFSNYGETSRVVALEIVSDLLLASHCEVGMYRPVPISQRNRPEISGDSGTDKPNEGTTTGLSVKAANTASWRDA